MFRDKPGERVGINPHARGPIFLLFMLTVSASANPFKRDIAKPGNEAYAQEEYGKAIAEYTKAQDLEPLSCEVRFNLGAAQFRQEEYDTALEEFSEAVRADDPKMAAAAYYNLGNARYKKSKREFEAASIVAQGQEGAPNPVQEYVQKLENCIQDYEECLKRDPNDEEAKYNLEVIRREIKNLMRQDPNPPQNQDRQQEEQERNQQQQEQQEKGEDENQEQPKEGEGDATPTPEPQPQPGEATPTPGQSEPNSASETSEAEPEPTQTLDISEEMARNILDNLPERRPRQRRGSRKNVEKDW